MISSSLVFVAVIKENNLGKKECVWHTGSSPSPGEVRMGVQNRILEAGTVAKAMEECCLQGASSMTCFPCFFKQPRTTIPGVIASWA